MVVPPKSVVRLAAFTVFPNVVIPVPVLFAAIFPNVAVPPTAPSKLILPVPVVTVKSFVPLTVDLKAIAEFVLLAVTLPVSETASL